MEVWERIKEFLLYPLITFSEERITLGALLLAILALLLAHFLSLWTTRLIEKKLTTRWLTESARLVTSRVARVLVLLLGGFVALRILGVHSETIIEQLALALHAPLVVLSGGTLTLGSILTGVVVVAVARYLSGFAARGTEKILAARHLPHSAQFAASKIVRYVVILLGVMVALNSMGIKLDAVLAASAVLLVGIGLGLQNIIQNLVSGIILLLEQPVKKGDFIEVGTTHGTVEDIGLRAIRVITRDGVTILVPNSEIVTSRVTNMSSLKNRTRIAVSVGVKYGSDAELVRKVLLSVVEGVPHITKEPAPEVFFSSFGEFRMEFTLLVWIDNPREDLRVASHLRFAIDAAFRAHNLEIPIPQRDLYVKSGLEALQK